MKYIFDYRSMLRDSLEEISSNLATEEFLRGTNTEAFHYYKGQQDLIINLIENADGIVREVFPEYCSPFNHLSCTWPVSNREMCLDLAKKEKDDYIKIIDTEEVDDWLDAVPWTDEDWKEADEKEI